MAHNLWVMDSVLPWNSEKSEKLWSKPMKSKSEKAFSRTFLLKECIVLVALDNMHYSLEQAS